MTQEVKTIFFSILTMSLGASQLYYFNLPLYSYVIWFASLPVIFVMFRSIHSIAIFYRCLLPAIIGLLFIVFYIESHKIAFIRQNFLSLPINEFYGEQFYAVISTLYAIITALVLVKGIESFDQLSSAVNDEANKIRSILEFLEYFDDGKSSDVKLRILNIRKIFRNYALNILKHANASDNEENFHTLRRCCSEVALLKCKDENDRIALAEVMKGMNELFAIRSKRISSAMAKIPLYLIIALTIMSLSIILPFFLQSPTPVSQNYTMIFIMATFGSFLVLMLLDINTPFDGFWRVDLKPFEELKTVIEQDIGTESDSSRESATRFADMPKSA